MEMARFDALEFESIHTCYFGYSANTRLPRAFFALKDDAHAGKWGQFVLDRGWLGKKHAGTFAVVISASSSTSALTRQELEADVARQLATDFGMPELTSPLWVQTVSEQQATFVCKPALIRPEMKSSKPGLVFAGDYVRSEYPGTLESAVRSGIKAAASVLKEDWRTTT
jgi:predicted NAD/FAD-dependent oxidoreductase